MNKQYLIKWCAVLLIALTTWQGSSLLKGEELKLFHWPNGKKAAVSLSFDDARLSQIDTGLALLKKEEESFEQRDILLEVIFLVNFLIIFIPTAAVSYISAVHLSPH